MATNLFLNDIIAGIKHGITGNENWKQSGNADAPANSNSYLVVLLYNSTQNAVCASSTPLPVDDNDFIKTGAENTITFGNIPYTETYTTGNVTGSGFSADRFCIYKASGSDLTQVEIPDADGNNVKKYILGGTGLSNLPGGNIVISGTITAQTINPNNAFTMTGITLTIS